jgi:hypothetical protein
VTEPANCFCMWPFTRLALGVLLVGVLGFAPAGAADNRVEDPGFEQRSEAWHTSGAARRYAVVADQGRDGGACLRYHKAGEQSLPDGRPENSHHDQVVSVKPGTHYVAGAWFRAEGEMRPVLRVASTDWQTLTAAVAAASTEWREARAIFQSGEREEIRIQIFGGAKTEKRETAVGLSYCDDVFVREAAEEDLAPLRGCEVRIDAGEALREINPMFFGVNTLFWIEDDASRADGKITKLLREMPCGFMRFPGGEVADNFHWKTNRLDDINHFPKSDGPDKLSVDKFIPWCREIGAEPVFVVNLESGFKSSDVEAGVREAADWVRYSNIEKKYGVRFWEIGNESNLRGTRFPLTAREYGEAVVRFSKAMKAVDPSIRIGALGPRGLDEGQQIEAVPEGELPRLRLLGKTKRLEEIAKIMEDAKPRKPRPWWPTVARIAGAQMDFAIIHQYSSPKTWEHYEQSPITEGENVAALHRFFEKQFPDRTIPIALTEWNTNKMSEVQGIGQALMLAEKIGGYLEGGVDMANHWPMRYPSREWNSRSLLDLETNEPRPPYHVMQLFASNIGARLLKCESSNPKVYACAGQSEAGDAVAVFLVNKSLEKAGIEARIAVSGLGPLTAEAVTLTAPNLEDVEFDRRALPVQRDGEGWTCQLPPHSLTMIRLSGRGR